MQKGHDANIFPNRFNDQNVDYYTDTDQPFLLKDE